MADFVNQLAYDFLPIRPIAAEYDSIFASDDDVRRAVDTVSLGQTLHFFSGCEARGCVVCGNQFFAVKAFLCRRPAFESGGIRQIDFLFVYGFENSGVLPDTSNPKR